jgi:lipopolysaccharide export LptBFGC system permease protein LptF
MSIEKRLYHFFHDGFGNLDSKVTSLIEEGKKNEVVELEKDFRKYENIFTSIKYLTGAFAIYQGAELTSDLITGDPSNYEIYFKSSLTATSGFLSMHFNYATKLYKTLVDKILKKDSSTNKSEIYKWQRNGKISHLAGVISMGAIVGPMAYSFAQQNPIIGGVMLGVMSYGVYHNFLKGYSALYKGMADFITGEIKFHPEPTPSK